MYQKFLTFIKRDEKSPYKVILFCLLIIVSPAIFKIIDHNFQKFLALNKFINVFDFIFLPFLTFLYLKKDEFHSRFSLNLVLFILYLVLARLSILFSIDQIHHRAFYDLFRAFLIFFVIFFIFSESFDKNKKNISKIFLVLFFSYAFFQTTIAIMQFILQKPLGFTFFHERVFGHEYAGSCSIFISEKAKFFLKYLPSNNNLFLRAHGTFIHPNVLSGFLCVSSLLTLYFIYKSKNMFFSFFLFVQIIALILTFSRAAIASFFISSFCFFALMLLKKYNIKKVFLLFLAIFLAVSVLGSKQFIERGFFGKKFQSKDASLMNMQSDSTRESLKNASINMIKKHPFFGVGFRNFLIKRDEYSNIKTERAYVHNIYLLMAAETGIISLLVFFTMIFFIFFETFRYFLTPFKITVFCITLSFLLIGFFDHYPISSNFGKIIIFGSLSILSYLNKVNKPFSYSQKAFLYQ